MEKLYINFEKLNCFMTINIKYMEMFWFFLDEQKNAFFFENLNSFLALNLSSNIKKEIEFKFKPSTLRNENKVIATIEMKDKKQIKVCYEIWYPLSLS